MTDHASEEKSKNLQLECNQLNDLLTFQQNINPYRMDFRQQNVIFELFLLMLYHHRRQYQTVYLPLFEIT